MGRSGAWRSYLASAQATGSCIIPCDAARLFVVIYHCIESKTLRVTIRMRIINLSPNARHEDCASNLWTRDASFPRCSSAPK
jgi:hypothetical protein